MLTEWPNRTDTASQPRACDETVEDLYSVESDGFYSDLPSQTKQRPSPKQLDMAEG